MSRASEIQHKLQLMRQALQETQAAGIRLRGTDWFAWATAGACHTVLLAAETGVAEVLVTLDSAWILTNEIEAQRFQDEELGAELAEHYKLFVHPWSDPDATETFIQKVTDAGTLISDRPTAAESPLPATLVQHKRILLPNELDRYRRVGRLASEAMTEVLLAAEPSWSEYQLAGAGAEALWSRGLHPALTLVAGEKRLPRYRHPIPTQEPLGRVAMLVFCARGYGLYANLTRFVCFGSLTPVEADLHHQVQQIEAACLNQARPGTALSQVYEVLAQAYQRLGYPDVIQEHHQGGTTGYLSREVIATPTCLEILTANMAMAWNPSLAGAKIEDTFVLLADGSLENLTFDPTWPAVEIAGRLRPLPLER